MKNLSKSKVGIGVISLALAMIVSLGFTNYSSATTATPTTSNADQQGIEVTSPIEGETYQLGDTIKIRWSNLTVHIRAADIKISLMPMLPACLNSYPACEMPTPAPYVITEKTSDDGVYDWTIPTSLSSTYYSNVQIRVEEVDSAISGQSGFFNIKANQDTERIHPVGSLLLGLDGIPTEGSLIVEVGDTTMRKIFPSGEVFMSHGYKWEKFVRGNSADQALPVTSSFTFAPGSLIKSSDSAAVYLVSREKTLRPFSSWNIFVQYGYKANMIWNMAHINFNEYTVSSPINTLERHVDGTEIVRNGTVYFIDAGVLHPYRNLEIYNSWHTYNNDFSRVVQANSFDNALPIGSFQTMRYYPN